MVFESQLAEQVFKSKYLLEGETEPEQAVERLVKSASKVYPEIEEETREYIIKQWFLPGGGIWRAGGNPNQNVSHVNCTTLEPVKDNLESIFDSLYKWAKYAAFGQGEGIDISLLRPKGSKVHNSSRESTGAVSFMSLYDAVLKVISQQGRRGASLISIKDTHPDLLDFIHIKDKPEGDPSRIDTANLSIQVSDEFMKCVEEDTEWMLRFENKYEVIEQKVKAKFIFDEICNMAWKHGCPGLQFISTWKKFSNSDAFGFPLVSSNACGEIPNDAENICDLGHYNLAKFSEYGWNGFIKMIKWSVKYLNAVRINEYNENRSPTKKQREKLILMPRIGLGHTGFADYLIDNKVVYGSDKSVEMLRELHKCMVKNAFEVSYELADKYGSFPNYDKDNMMKSGYIQAMLKEGVITESILEKQFNVQLFTLAPVGSGSLVANVAGSGVEPMFSKYSVRRERATTKEYKDWFTFNPYIERFLKNNNLEVTRENCDALTADYWVMSYDVKATDKMKLVAEAQKWIDSSISVTFNMPKESTVEEVKEIYLNAWKSNLKGVTVYREGSLSGVIITEKNYKESLKEEVKSKEKYKGHDYIKRPDSLPCDIHEAKYKDDKFVILVGLNNDKPYEVFVTPNNEGEIDVEKYKKGFIVKQKSNHYDLIVQNGITKTMVNNIGKSFDSLYGTVSRMVSMSLRHDVHLEFIIDQLNKDSGFIAFEKVLSRVLKKYVKDNTETKKKCPECGATLVYQNGCIGCSSCSYSKCE